VTEGILGRIALLRHTVLVNIPKGLLYTMSLDGSKDICAFHQGHFTATPRLIQFCPLVCQIASM
jgi:hypothetical protein